MPLTPGTRLGPYESLALIGAGGMGEVYKARDTRLNRDVAIKVLPESFAEDDDRLRRFQLEAQSAGALNHPNILTVYDIGTYEKSPYLVSELLEGESLAERLRRGKLSTAKSIDYARQITAGLAAAHAKGITHRDIKPDNLFLTKDGRIKILDFGLAKQTSAPSTSDKTATVTSTQAGVVMGTAAYMSPEQARGQVVDQRSDIFSFGCVLYEMLTGTRAFRGETNADLTGAILKDDPDLSGITPPGLQRIVAHCLEKSPEQRFQSAGDVGFALEAVTLQDSGPKPAYPQPPKKTWLVRALMLSSLVLAIASASFAYLYFRPSPSKTFHRLTFRRGKIHAARFTPDGNGVAYSAQWESEPSEVFTARFDTPGSRAIGFPGSELRAISPTGELALVQNARIIANPFAYVGMLALAPFSGGASKAVEDKIDFAEWSPDGTEMALVRETDQGTQLEYPAGKILYQTAGYIGEPRISPDGKLIAFWDHPLPNDNRGTVAMVDKSGRKKTLTSDYQAAEGLAWKPAGDEIWFTAAKTGAVNVLCAVTMGGRERTIYSQSSSLVLRDISKDGRVLVTSFDQRMKLVFRGEKENTDRELSWLDWSLLSSLSRDGKFVAFFETGEGAGDARLAFLRDTSGAPAVSLGTGGWPYFSPDGQFLVTSDNRSSTVTIYPVGPGQSKHMTFPGFILDRAGVLPDNKTIWFYGNEPSRPARYYLAAMDGAKPRPISPEGVRGLRPGLVMDGKYVAGTAGGKNWLYPVAGGEARPVAGMQEGEWIAGWTEDGTGLYVYSRNEIPVKLNRVDLSTGRREVIKEITPSDRAGIGTGVGYLMITPNGKTYAYSIAQDLSELHWVEGLK
jgi:serine/threonine protein kinase/Tol biopolymer transport system component